MIPTSWNICFDSGLKGLNEWPCRRCRWRACRFGWFSIFWINSRTLALCACFTIECGNPGMLKSMSSSILSRIVSLSVLSVLISWYTSGSSCTATLCLSSCPDVSWVCSTLRLLLSSDEHAWTLITSCVKSGCPDLSEERDVFLITSCVISSCPDLSQFGLGIGWVGWKNFACRTTSPSGCRTTFEPNSLVQSWRSEIFGGGRGDMYAFSKKTSPVFSPDNFRNTISWECVVEGWLHSIESDSVSILSELQDQCNDPIYRVLVFLPSVCAGIVHDVVHLGQSFRDLYALCLWDQ